MESAKEKKYNIRNGINKAIRVALAVIVQIVWIYLTVCHLRDEYPFVAVLLNVIAFILVISIYSSQTTSTIKTTWIMLIMLIPAFGITIYLLAGWNSGTVAMKKRYVEVNKEIFPSCPPNEETMKLLEEQDLRVANQSRYIQDYGQYPLYQNTDVEFYDDAAKGLEAQIEDLKKAQKYILMEYHAIEDSESFSKIYDILTDKVKQGVEVLLIYDYVGSMGFIGNSFAKKMKAAGIKCCVFNPAMAIMNLFLNNRDHRKITVIDGVVGFVGGYNLADEYFHVTEPYGYWLDTGVRLEGEAVKSLIVTFMENWKVCNKKEYKDVDINDYIVDCSYSARENGFVQPYADNPMDNERTGENVYINVLRSAKEYAYFTTPYLTITDEMRSAFAMAAKSGVDVRIITPGIPDKKMVYSVTRSYYTELVQCGVRIFEYTPGFCHAKQCVSDDKTAICGTINLDFRSLYHHFENGVFLYNCDAVEQIKTHFDELFPVCHEVTDEYKTTKIGIYRLKELLLRLVAPML